MNPVRRSVPLLLAAVSLTAAACSDNGPSAPGSSGTDFTDAASLIAAQASAIASMDADRYAALLESPDAHGDGGFRYYPSARALASLAWLGGDSWGYHDETGMMTHLLDPDYVSDTLGASVQRMECSLLAQQAFAGAGGTTLVHATMAVRATMTQGPAIALQQPVTLELARDANGFVRLRSVREQATLRTAAGVGSWTELMVAFRGGAATPEGLLDAYESALANRDCDAYAELLHPDFEYVPQSADLADLPWLTPDHPWNLGEELDMVCNMFDPFYVSGPTGNSVDTIEAELTPLAQEPVEGGVKLTAAADIRVLWDTNAGAFSAVRLVFTMTSDAGRYRIRKIEEHADHARTIPGGRVASGVDVVEVMTWTRGKSLFRSTEESSWGSIKGLFRTSAIGADTSR